MSKEMAENSSSDFSFDVNPEEVTTNPLGTTWVLDFWDFNRRDKYRAFKLQSFSAWYLSLVSIIATLLFTLYWVFVFYVYQNWLEYFVCISSVVFSLLPLWIRTFQRESYEEHDVEVRTNLALLESLVVAGFTLSTGLTLTMRVINGQCPSTYFVFIWGCLPGEMCRTIPSDLSLIMMLLPLFFAIILPCLPSWVAFSSFFVSVIIVATNISVVKATSSIAWLICVSALIATIMYFYLKQRLELFVFTCNFKRVLDRANRERERNATRFITQMRNLIFGISHDLKSPLTSAGYGIDLLKLSVTEIEDLYTSPTEQLKQKLNWIDVACRNLEASHQLMIMAINRCTDYTKICNKLPLQPQISVVEIKRVIHHCLSVVRSALEDCRIDVQYTDLDIENRCILTDESWLLNNLLCVVSNAVCFSSDNAATITLKWIVIKESTHLMLEVWNFGEVLNLEDREQAFKSPTLSSARAAGGVGLGLFCLARRVDALGGSYGCSDETRNNAEGMSFWFTVPSKTDRSAHSDGTPQKQIIDQLRILVVDDSKTILKMLKMMLEKQHHFVDIAYNGLEAMKQLKIHDFNYHIILMDLQMPIMDGFSAVKLIRSTEHTNPVAPRMVVIAMSAGTDEEIISKINDYGFDYFLSKPFKLNSFDQIWKKYFESRSDVVENKN